MCRYWLSESAIAMRFFQAIGGCAALVAAQALVRDLFPINKAAQAFLLYNLGCRRITNEYSNNRWACHRRLQLALGIYHFGKRHVCNFYRRPFLSFPEEEGPILQSLSFLKP